MRLMRAGLSTLLTFSLVLGGLALWRAAAEPSADPVTTDVAPAAEEMSDAEAEEAISPEVEVEQLAFDEQAEPAAQEAAPFAAQEETAGEAQELAPADTKPFQMVGVTWDPGQDVDVNVRVKVRQNGQWTDWIDLGGVSDAAGDEGGRPGTEPLWLDAPADGLEVEATTADGQTVEGLEATAIDPGDDPAEASTEDLSPRVAPASGLATATPAPPIIGRSAWGAGAGGHCSAPVTAPKTLGVVLHHTAGANGTPASQSASIIRGYQTYHISGQKWCDIGYNFLVDWHGQIFEGRKGGIYNQVRGAHSGNFDVNLNATGVAMMGTFETTEPPEAMKNAVVQLVAWKLSSNNVNPYGTYTTGGRTYNVINGHRDVVATACPGARGYAWISASNGLRARVASAAVPGQAAIDAEYQRRKATLGSPTSSYLTLPGGSGRAYQQGSIYWTQQASARSVFGPIRTEYFRRNGATGPLGFPISNIGEYPVKGSTASGEGQAYQKGSIFSWKEGTFAVPSPIRERWSSHWSGVKGQLGWPTSNAATYSANGGGTGQAFQGGSMFSNKTGTFAVKDPLRKTWVAAGGVSGQYGWPASDEATYSANGGGTGQAFQKASVFTNKDGTHWVPSPIRERWSSHWSGVKGQLGWPTSNAATYSANGGGTGQAFQGGSMFSNKTGTFAVKDPLRKTWVAAGGVSGQYGWPASDEATYTPNGGGTGQAFQKASVFTNKDGTYWVTDRFRTWWVNQGGVSGKYGWPTSAMTCDDRACWQDFQGGQLQWLSADGVVRAVEGATRTAYRSAGGPKGQLGPATSASGNYGPGNTGTGQAFAGGSIFVSSSGSFIVPDPLRPVWVALGGVTGSYGWPTSQATRYPANGGGTGQAFERGSVFTSSAGTFGVPQAIRTFWVNRGGVSGADGWPISKAANYSANGGGTGQAFKNASIFISNKTGTHAVSGAMRTLWVNQGGVSGKYGWPTGAMKCQGSTCTQTFQGGTLTAR